MIHLQVKIDKFLCVFMPHSVSLHYCYNYTATTTIYYNYTAITPYNSMLLLQLNLLP